MIMRILFLLLVSISGYGQLVNNNIMLHSAGRDTVEIPYPFFANSVDTDSIRVEWIDVDADNYILESDDNEDFTSPTVEYSGSNLSYTKTGLFAGQKFYLRLRGQKAGMVDSRYAIDTAATFPFHPLVHYEFTGLAQEDNIYGDYASGADYNQFNSVINYSGTPLLPVGSGGIYLDGMNWTAYPAYFTAYCAPSSSYVLNDFEINILVTFNGSIVNNEIFDNTGDAAQYIRFNSYSQIRFSRTTGATLTLDNAMEEGKSYYLTFQRSGTTFTVIVKDVNGVTQTKTGTVPSTEVTFNRVFNVSTNYYIQRINIASHVLNTNERDSVRNYLSRKVFVPEANDTTTAPKGLTYNTLSSAYFANSDFPNTVSGSWMRDKFYGWGNYQFLCVQEKFETPNLGRDLVYVMKGTNQISDVIDMGIPDPSSDDNHNSGGLNFWNNMVVHIEQSKHRGGGESDNSIVIKMFGKDMNMINWKEVPVTKDVVSYASLNMQYYQSVIIDGIIYIVGQEANERTVLLISNDEWTSFRKYYIMVNNGDSDFLYHQLIYSEDKLILVVDHEEQPGNDHRAAYILVADPSTPTVFSNVAGTFSKDISTSGPITLAEGDTNYLLGTAITGSPGDLTSVKPSFGVYDPSQNEAYIVRHNGSDDGLVLCEVDFTAETITEYAIPETIDGHTVDVSCTGSGVTNQPFVYKDGSMYYAILGEVNAGNTKIMRASSADGTTWDYVDQISSDDTKPHIRIMPTKNWYYTESRSIFASRDQTTFGDLFIYNISTP